MLAFFFTSEGSGEGFLLSSCFVRLIHNFLLSSTRDAIPVRTFRLFVFHVPLLTWGYLRTMPGFALFMLAFFVYDSHTSLEESSTMYIPDACYDRFSTYFGWKRRFWTKGLLSSPKLSEFHFVLFFIFALFFVLSFGHGIIHQYVALPIPSEPGFRAICCRKHKGPRSL